ncbi:hypothetical protein MPI44_004459 [Klebsiella oxytoca]|nr:hypothetical protein [Klebsiella oxytoca]
MNLYKYLIVLTGVISGASANGVYHFGRLYFLPVWRGGFEDKSLISLALLAFLVLFLVVFEHFLTMTIYSVVRFFRSPYHVNFSSITAIVKAVILPFKFIAYFSSMVIGTGVLSVGGGFISGLIVGYIYFFKMPDINKEINKKIAGGITNETKVN